MSYRNATKRIARSKKGYTLVEMIVVFVISAILMTAAGMTLTTFINVYTRISDTADAHTLLDTLTETVSGTLGSAQNSRINEDDLAAMRITDGKRVEYRDRNGYPMELYVDADTERLVLHYLEVKSDTGVVERSDVYWGLGQGVYCGYNITGFSVLPVDNTNLLHVEITITDYVTQRSFSTERTVECYNLVANSIFIS